MFFFFEKNTYLVCNKFDFAFYDICNPSNMNSVTKYDILSYFSFFTVKEAVAAIAVAAPVKIILI